uniref:Uncharacterized protein n=1 Tax=Zea mays TaxID=4577 RepID=B6UG92_MAIZE|nr:hypothetical protein [Zea mays]
MDLQSSGPIISRRTASSNNLSSPAMTSTHSKLSSEDRHLRACSRAVRSRGSEESPWYLESQVLGEEQVVQEEPPNTEEFDLI